MPKSHTVKQGDTMIAIAEAHGFRNWKTIWYHGANEGLRGRRPNPQVLAPGDVVVIPDLFDAPVEVETNRRHTFRLKKRTAYFSVRLLDETEQPYRNARYELTVDGETLSGTTDGDGWVSKEVPPTAKKGELKLWRTERDVATWNVEIGTMDPVELMSGVKARLKNLGYQPGPGDELDEQTRFALAAFQRHQGLEPAEGDLDDPTRGALVRAHNQH
jgi:N-acetylmuramoyl-L-alanine amidase